MDNKIFNVNGRGLEMLTKTLELAFYNNGHGFAFPKEPTVQGYVIHKDLGLILLSFLSDSHGQPTKEIKFPTPLDFKVASGIVHKWLESDEAKTITLKSWDMDSEHDGTNELGWRVYCGDWGHVGTYSNALVAITPAYMWYGK